ncbi:hypothetical protein BF385_003377 [Escherichia coli]|nr:hypothetical protein [Escherichia coli]
MCIYLNLMILIKIIRGFISAELPFEPEFIDDLATKGLHTLFDVVTRRHEQLVVELGLEETAARRLLDVCYARSDAWEKENGGTIYVR